MISKNNSFSIWFFGWALLLAFGWLLPNHDLPWRSFHSEIWVALAFSLIMPWVIIKSPPRIYCGVFECAVLILAAIPFFQFLFGRIPYIGQAWICSSYLMGFFLAIFAGRIVELSRPGLLTDYLFLSIGIAAAFSVMLQLYQWLELDGFGIWLMDTNRMAPSANIGQRNNLATLLLWGALAFFWGVQRRIIGIFVFIPLMLMILFGVALTGSRTAWIAVFFIVFFSWHWRQYWQYKNTSWLVGLFGIYFLGCVAGLRFFRSTNLLDAPKLGQQLVEGVVGDSRLDIWSISLGAISERPFFGYGFAQIAEAQISVATEYPALHAVFSQSHNLFLDLVLWCGIPIGLGLSAYLVYWFWSQCRQVKSSEGGILFLFLLVVANHSMLEFPLQYAYFLIPVGAVIGAMITFRKIDTGLIQLNKNSIIVMWLFSVIMLGVTVADYLKIEHSYRLLKMEWAGFNLELSPQPPDVLALNQWHQIIKQARVFPHKCMDDAELQTLRNVAMQAHKPFDFLNLAYALYFNGKGQEAGLWLERMCKVETPQSCAVAQEGFENVKKQKRSALRCDR